MTLQSFLQQSLTKNNFHYSEEIQKQFLTYLELLDKWNKVFNLTAIKNPEEQVMLHIVDSLAVNPFLHGTRIIDVGTGAGLPGIPLAIVNPDKHFTLLDSNSKKTRFLTQAVTELKLKNIEVVHYRCDTYQPAQCFDTVVSRAFAAIEVMLSATKHLICKNGIFLAMKGVYPEAEIAQIPPEFIAAAVHKLEIQGLNAERCAVCIRNKNHG